MPSAAETSDSLCSKTLESRPPLKPTRIEVPGSRAGRGSKDAVIALLPTRLSWLLDFQFEPTNPAGGEIENEGAEGATDEAQHAVEDRQYIVPGGGGMGEVMNNAYV